MLNERTNNATPLEFASTEWWTTFLAIEHSSFAYRSLHFSLFFFLFSFFFFFRKFESACPSRESIIFSFSEEVNPFGNEKYRALPPHSKMANKRGMTCKCLMDTYGFGLIMRRWKNLSWIISRYEEKFVKVSFIRDRV